MRWWDGATRVHVGLVATNAAAIGALAEGWPSWGAWGASVLAAGMILKSLRPREHREPLILSDVPWPEGGCLVGRGFEWTVREAQESLDSGYAAARPESDLVLPDSMLEQHVLILGTTGAGKSRLLELLALQAVARGDAVVVVDPKGDAGLLDQVRRAASNRFRLFSLPHPERSVKYNPLGRYHQIHEVADRIAALLPATGDALPFRNFAWSVVNTVARELHGKKPITARNLRRYAVDRPVAALKKHPRDHLLKMLSALLPLLSKLSLDVLSPAKGGLTWTDVDQDRLVVYFDLGSLLGGDSSSAVARLVLADLRSFVGSRYAFSKNRNPLWLFVDELGDVASPEFIGLLNKSRGAGLRVVACGQTAADLEAALGSRAHALQVLGNASSIVQFRAQSAEDAGRFSEMTGDRLLRTTAEAAAYEPALFSSGFESVDDFRARFGETADWRDRPMVPPWAVAQLPTFHYFARWPGSVVKGRVPLMAR